MVRAARSAMARSKSAIRGSCWPTSTPRSRRSPRRPPAAPRYPPPSLSKTSRRGDRGSLWLPLVHRHAQGGSDDGRDPPPRAGAAQLALQSGSAQGYIGLGNDLEVAMDDKTRTELEAATFRRLVEHLRERTDVQNIDLMNLAGFCRNCLSKWYRAEAEDRGLALTDPESREIVYGMPYDEWRAKPQKEASAEQKAAFAAAEKH